MKKNFKYLSFGIILLSFSCAKKEDIAAQLPPVEIAPKVSNAAEGSQINFFAAGGLGLYKFKVISGQGDVTVSTGILTNTRAGQIVVRVTDLIGSYDDAIVNVSRDFSLNTSTMYLVYTQQATLQYSGGTPPVVYSRVSGPSTVEPNTGVITAASSLSKTIVKVTDGDGNVQLCEVFAVPPLQFDELSLTLTYGEEHQFQVHGGVPPYSYTIVAGSGTMLSQQGIFIAPYNDNNPVVRVTDSVGMQRDIQIRVISGN